MKRLQFVCLFAFLAARIHAQPVVIALTPDLDKITIQNHLEEIAKLGALIEQMTTTKDWLGNAANIIDIAGASDVLNNLQNVGVGKSRVELATSATSQEALFYDDAGLYQALGDEFVTRDGRTLARSDEFKPEAAVFNAVASHDAVQEDVAARRESLRGAMQQTLSQSQAATTHAEVQKATGVLIAQHAELAATDAELSAAMQKALLLDVQNRAERDRQEKAAQQEQAQEFTEAVRLFSTTLRPPTFIQPAKPATTATR